MFSRTLVATRISLLVGVIAVSIGWPSASRSGRCRATTAAGVDSVIMRLADVFFAYPYILFVLLIMTVLGPGFVNVFLAIGILGWASFARLNRGSVLSVKATEFIEAARAQGASDLRIIFRHVLPNTMAPVYVAIAMAVGGAIVTEAALSYLGIGIQPPNASWGSMIADNHELSPRGTWWTLALPVRGAGDHGVRVHLVRQRPARRHRPQAEGIGVAERLLEVKDLSTHFFTHAGVVKAVNGVSFTLDRDETLGIVGESGSGKTVAALSLMRLIPDPPGKIVDGIINFRAAICWT